MMKHPSIFILLVAAILSFESCGVTQTVHTNTHNRKSQPCHFDYYACTSDGKTCLFLELWSDTYVFMTHPTLHLTNFAGQHLTLRGMTLPSRVIGIGTKLESIRNVGMAEFELSPEEIDFFAEGIQHITISTAPIPQKMTYYTDRIGKKIYQMLTEAATEPAAEPLSGETSCRSRQ